MTEHQERDIENTGTLLVTPANAHPVLDVETQSFLDHLADSGGLPIHFLEPMNARVELARIQVSLFEPAAVTYQDLTISTPMFGSLNIRVVRPKRSIGALPIVLYLHGGGWVMGDRDTHDRLIRELAVGADVAVIFVEYSTVLGTQYPIQNEQAYAALCYVVEQAESLELLGDRVAVAGDGVGGNMAAAMTLLTRRRQGPHIDFQLLFYPVMGLPDGSASYLEFAFGPWLTAQAMRRYISAQFPVASLTNQEALPGNASMISLEGMPAALIITAENDVLRDEGEAYARKLIQAGCSVTAIRYIGCIHDFIMLNDLADSPPARAAMSQSCAALRLALHN